MILELYERLDQRRWLDIVKLPLLFVFSLVFFVLGAHSVSAMPFQFTETTGRAVILDDAAQQEARLLALEEALYLAALRGGARINGFSAITADTSLEDHFVVRPASRILDYTITNEVIDDQHYQVTIRAAVGDLPRGTCLHERAVNLTLFAPIMRQAPDTPANAGPMAEQVIATLVDVIDVKPALNARLATTTRLDPARLARANDSFDYEALTTGLTRVRKGDFAMIPEIVLTGSLGGSEVFRKEVLHMDIMLHLFSGEEYEFIETFSRRASLHVQNKTVFRSFDVLTRATRPDMLRQMLAHVEPLVSEMTNTLRCRPLTATLAIVDGRLQVPIGSYHGMRQNVLAIASGTDTPWHIMRVTQVNAMSSQLTPLNSNRDLSRLVGQTVEFMEMSR